MQELTVAITGASSGIGAALAVEAVKRGATTLFLCGRNLTGLEKTRNACLKIRGMSPSEGGLSPSKGGLSPSEGGLSPSKGGLSPSQGGLSPSEGGLSPSQGGLSPSEGGLSPIKIYLKINDVSDEISTSKWIEECEKAKPLNIVFANAGVSTGLESEEHVRNTFSINVNGTVNTVLPAIEIFRRRDDGSRRQIVITSSIAGYAPLSACPSYSATKACVKTWGLSLRGHLAKYGIKVNVICPGFVRSGITDKNTCPMPFFMEADKAAALIWRRVEKNTGLIAFPWPMRLAVWFLSACPQPIAEAIAKLLPKKN